LFRKLRIQVRILIYQTCMASFIQWNQLYTDCVTYTLQLDFQVQACIRLFLIPQKHCHTLSHNPCVYQILVMQRHSHDIEVLTTVKHKEKKSNGKKIHINTKLDKVIMVNLQLLSRAAIFNPRRIKSIVLPPGLD
jgi:hypothetical protein